MNNSVSIQAGTKIFLVEDDAFISMMLVKNFENAGAIVTTDARGDTAAANIKKTMPNIVLLDIQLPGATGLEILEQIKNDPETKNIPAVMLSNFGDKEKIAKAKQLGALAFLIKATLPVDEIVGEIAKLLKTETMTRG
jgi:CheY-like chemotaxis protein